MPVSGVGFVVYASVATIFDFPGVNVAIDMFDGSLTSSMACSGSIDESSTSIGTSLALRTPSLLCTLLTSASGRRDLALCNPCVGRRCFFLSSLLHLLNSAILGLPGDAFGRIVVVPRGNGLLSRVIKLVVFLVFAFFIGVCKMLDAGLTLGLFDHFIFGV